jgi:hypothetical protein
VDKIERNPAPTIAFEKTSAGTWVATARVAGKTITAEGETASKARLAIIEAIRKLVVDEDPPS